MEKDAFYTLKELAALLKVADKTIYSMAQDGHLPGFKVRGQWRFARKDIETWIQEQKEMRLRGERDVK
ncbi:MAG: helix-turn-helix domain-containing protein [Syntrophobacteraceae bacterium]